MAGTRNGMPPATKAGAAESIQPTAIGKVESGPPEADPEYIMPSVPPRASRRSRVSRTAKNSVVDGDGNERISRASMSVNEKLKHNRELKKMLVEATEPSTRRDSIASKRRDSLSSDGSEKSTSSKRSRISQLLEGHEDDDGITGPALYVKTRRICKAIVGAAAFDSIIGTIILFNAITIGMGVQNKVDCVQQNKSIDGCPSALGVLENVFLIIYTVELAMKVIADGIDVIQDKWWRGDLFFVVLGYFDLIASVANLDTKFLSLVMLLRSLRLLRLARPLRLLSQFKELWTLVAGLMVSVGTVIYTTVLILIIIYIFACLAVNLITEPGVDHSGKSEAYRTIQKSYFKDLSHSMLTLTQFIALDSVAAIYKPLVEEEWNIEISFFFTILTMLVAVVLMNLITTVVIDNALDQTKNDIKAAKAKEKQQEQKLVERLRHYFKDLDEDGSGTLTYQEMSDRSKTNKAATISIALLKDLLDVDTLREVFAELEIEADNREHDIDEFIDKVKDWVSYDGEPSERRSERDLHKIHEKLDTIESDIDGLCHLIFEKSIDAVYSDAIGTQAKKTRSKQGSKEDVTKPMPKE